MPHSNVNMLVGRGWSRLGERPFVGLYQRISQLGLAKAKGDLVRYKGCVELARVESNLRRAVSVEGEGSHCGLTIFGDPIKKRFAKVAQWAYSFSRRRKLDQLFDSILSRICVTACRGMLPGFCNDGQANGIETP